MPDHSLLLQIVRVALDVPLRHLFDYRLPDHEQLSTADIGYRVCVPFGQRQKVGIIVELAAASELPLAQLKPVTAVLRDVPRLPAAWFHLTEFCAAYYHARLGQVMLSTLPTGWRSLAPVKARARRRAVPQTLAQQAPALTLEQEAAPYTGSFRTGKILGRALRLPTPVIPGESRGNSKETPSNSSAMVAKVTVPHSINRALNHNEQKVHRENAECLYASGFLKESADLNFYEKQERFEKLNELNKRAATNTLHVSLNFSPSEKLSKEQLVAIAKAYMEKIGWRSAIPGLCTS